MNDVYISAWKGWRNAHTHTRHAFNLCVCALAINTNIISFHLFIFCLSPTTSAIVKSTFLFILVWICMTQTCIHPSVCVCVCVRLTWLANLHSHALPPQSQSRWSSSWSGRSNHTILLLFTFVPWRFDQTRHTHTHTSWSEHTCPLLGHTNHFHLWTRLWKTVFKVTRKSGNICFSFLSKSNEDDRKFPFNFLHAINFLAKHFKLCQKTSLNGMRSHFLFMFKRQLVIKLWSTFLIHIKIPNWKCHII